VDSNVFDRAIFRAMDDAVQKASSPGRRVGYLRSILPGYIDEYRAGHEVQAVPF
jgi:hypothetical protein